MAHFLSLPFWLAATPGVRLTGVPPHGVVAVARSTKESDNTRSKGGITMTCPVCQKTMKDQDFGGVTVHVCVDGCKGMYFDWLQLQKLDHQNQGFGDALQAALKYPRTNDASRERLKCPKCGLPMYRHEFALDLEVNIDECYGCGGMFLDSGELQELRDHSMSAPQETAYLNKLVEDMPETKALEQQEAKDVQRADAMAHFTRFLRISYYVTGK